MPHVETHIDSFIRNKLSDTFPLISMFIGDKTINQLKDGFMKELRQIFPELMQKYMSNLKKDLDLEQIVIQKVQGFSSDKLEAVLNDIMKKEFFFVEIIGGVLGFVIGVLQVLLTFLTTG